MAVKKANRAGWGYVVVKSLNPCSPRARVCKGRYNCSSEPIDFLPRLLFGGDGGFRDKFSIVTMA
jgi:hypothetical protein